MEPRTLTRRTAIAGAATTWVRDRLVGPTRTGRVLHVGRDAAYVDLDGFCLGVLSRAATHVPCGIRTASASLVGLGPGLAQVGDQVLAGEGRLAFAGSDVVVARLVDAAAPRLSPTPDTAVRLAAAVPMATVTDELPTTALEALRAGDPDAVLSLLGRGSGLTPLGDDVLCGWLATARATGRDDAHSISDEVALHARERTTLLSATLLDCAARGDVLPQFRRLLDVLATEADPDTEPNTDPGPAVADLVRVGHTSGTGLAVGCLLALPEPRPPHLIPTPTDPPSTPQPDDEGNR